MTIAQMTALGEIARVLIYNPITFAVMLVIFLLVVLGGIDHE